MYNMPERIQSCHKSKQFTIDNQHTNTPRRRLLVHTPHTIITAMASSFRGEGAAAPAAPPPTPAPNPSAAPVPPPCSPVYDWLGDDVPPRHKRTVYFEGAPAWQIVLTDQPALPDQFRRARCATVAECARAIRTMVVRGAPAIGVTGAYGMVLAAREAMANATDAADAHSILACLAASKRVLDAARPTAVNLSWATARLLEYARLVLFENEPPSSPASPARIILAARLLEEAEQLADADVEVNFRMARVGASVVPRFPDRPTHVSHRCNTGALACTDWGTALGVIHYCHKVAGVRLHVWVDETRPRLQGSRLSAWELTQSGCPMHLVADGVAGSLMRRGRVDIVLFGADRVAANGDTVNKIGSFPLAVLAREHGVPVYPVVPTSTIDLACATGDDVEIEERGADELTGLRFAGTGAGVAPAGDPCYNPAFDSTPHKYLTGIITEEGVCYPPFGESLRRAKERAEARVRARWDRQRARRRGGGKL